MKHIQIRNSDMAWHIAANIQFPPNFDESKQYPAIISVHPFGSCKEQTSGNIYGKALAEKGYVVLAYDASFQGESGGEPRWIEDPTQRVEDISRVIDYELTSRNEPFKGTIVSRKSVAALITDIIDKPEKHIGENIGINQPGTDGDKPFFM